MNKAILYDTSYGGFANRRNRVSGFQIPVFSVADYKSATTEKGHLKRLPMRKNKIIFLFLCVFCNSSYLCCAQEYATNNITDSFDFSIGYIDKTADDAEIGSYDIIITNKYNFDTTIICRNIHYIDDNALKCSDNKLFYISTGLSLVVYDIFTKSYDTICNSYRGRFYLNSFLLMPNNHILLAAVNYQSEKIVFVELDFLNKKIIRKCSICEKNVGLEFLRINMQCAGEDVVNVKTTQCEYQISLKKRMYVKVHKVVESVSP